VSKLASTNAFAGTHSHQYSRTIPIAGKTHHHRTTTPVPLTTDPRAELKPITELRSHPTTALTDAVTTALRGGCQSKILQTLASSLRSGPYGIPALFALASAVNLPLTLYRQAYSFSVGYGFSVFAMATACALSIRPPTPSLTSANPSLLLASAAAFYGLRLGTFLLARELTVPSKAKVIKEMDKTPRLKRVPLVANVSLFYALMTGPVLYALRAPVPAGGVRAAVALGGAALAWGGAVLEAVTDLQKWSFNRGGGGNGGVVERVFVGPTGWAYSVVRHPNYLGEVLFWTGMFVGGVPSFGRNYVAWIGSTLGLAGIWAIMLNATKRLEGKQKESYGGQEAYENWTLRTRYPLLPFLG